MLLATGGALDVKLGATDTDTLPSRDAVVASRPDANAARLDSEEMTADMVAADGGAEVSEWISTGSLGISSSESSSSLCRPTGFRGRRRVPLLGAGVRPIESQMML